MGDTCLDVCNLVISSESEEIMEKYFGEPMDLSRSFWYTLMRPEFIFVGGEVMVKIWLNLF